MDIVQFYKENEDNYSTGKVRLDIVSMIGKETKLDPTKYATDEDKPKKKRGVINGIEMATREDNLPATATNVPYKDSYAETDAVLKTAIVQLDVATNEITQDIHEIRSSKTLRKKYDYLAMMHGSLGTLISTKVSAARELNNSIKNAADLEIKRAKEFKLNEQVDDTKAIMDTYNAFVSMPVSSSPINGYNSPLGPTTTDLTMLSANIMASAIGADPDLGYQNYMNNMKPEQAMMLYENNPDVKQVVVYNQDTFEKHFEIMNTRTGQIMHGLPKRNDAMYMPDTVIDLANKVARNINLDEVYDVVVVGSGMSEY